MTTQLNYDQLLKQAKQVLKRDRAAEKEFIETKLKFKDFTQSYYSDVFNPMIAEIIRLTQLGHEILIDKSYRRGQSQRIYYKLLPDQLTEAEAQARKEIQATLDAEYKAKLDAAVAELAVEFEAQEAAKLEAEAKSEKIKSAIMSKIMEL